MVLILVIAVGAIIVALGVALAPLILPLLGWGLVLLAIVAAIIGTLALGLRAFEALSDWMVDLPNSSRRAWHDPGLRSVARLLFFIVAACAIYVVGLALYYQL